MNEQNDSEHPPLHYHRRTGDVTMQETNGPLSKMGIIGWVFEKFGPVGVLCWLLWFLVSHELPKQRADYREETRYFRDQQEKHYIEMTKAISDNQRTIMQVQLQITDSQRSISQILEEVKRIRVKEKE